MIPIHIRKESKRVLLRMSRHNPVLLFIIISFLFLISINIYSYNGQVWVSVYTVNKTLPGNQYTRQKAKISQVLDSKQTVEEFLAKNIIPQVYIPFNMDLFTIKYREIIPELRLLKKEHKIAYDPRNHNIVSDQVRATLYALNCWEEIHTVTDQYGNKRYINNLEAKRELEQHEEEAGFDIAEYIEYNEYVNSLEKNVFQWAIKDMSVLQLKHSFKYKKGLATTMGNEQFDSGYATLKVLRDRGCTLPFEIFYLGEDDLSVEHRNKLSTLSDTTLIDISQYIIENIDGYACKPFVMLFSSFREVVFIDADSLFLQPAERVFVEPLYIQHGALFFFDRSMGNAPEWGVIRWMDDLIAGHNHLSSQKIMRSRYMHGFTANTQESGVVVIDKERHFGALLAVCQLNLEKERNITYSLVMGDKETFWLGFEMAGDSNWAFSPFTPGVFGPKLIDNTAWDQGPKKYRVCSSKIVHRDYNAKLLWFNGGLLRNKFAEDKEKMFEDFSYLSVEPGYWRYLDHNRACLHSTIEPTKIEKDSYVASWLDSHKKAFREVATDLPWIQDST